MNLGISEANGNIIISIQETDYREIMKNNQYLYASGNGVTS